MKRFIEFILNIVSCSAVLIASASILGFVFGVWWNFFSGWFGLGVGLFK